MQKTSSSWKAVCVTGISNQHVWKESIKYTQLRETGETIYIQAAKKKKNHKKLLLSLTDPIVIYLNSPALIFFWLCQHTEMKRTECNPRSLIDSQSKVGEGILDRAAGVIRSTACHVQFRHGEMTGAGASRLPSTPSKFPAHIRCVNSRLTLQPADTDVLSGHNDEDQINQAMRRIHFIISDKNILRSYMDSRWYNISSSPE